MVTTIYAGIVAFLISTCSGKVFDAKCTIAKTSGDPSVPMEGTLMLKYDDVTGQTTIKGTLKGFNQTSNSTTHGFHIHEYGKLTNGCKDAGGHFNPTNKQHGGPTSSERHIGDLGNVEENSRVVTVDIITDTVVKLDGTNHVVGKAIVVHQKADDFETQPTGDAGGRLGCCIITMDPSGSKVNTLDPSGSKVNTLESSGSKVNYSVTSMIAILATYFLFFR